MFSPALFPGSLTAVTPATDAEAAASETAAPERDPQSTVDGQIPFAAFVAAAASRDKLGRLDDQSGPGGATASPAAPRSERPTLDPQRHTANHLSAVSTPLSAVSTPPPQPLTASAGPPTAAAPLPLAAKLTDQAAQPPTAVVPNTAASVSQTSQPADQRQAPDTDLPHSAEPAADLAAPTVSREAMAEGGVRPPTHEPTHASPITAAPAAADQPQPAAAVAGTSPLVLPPVGEPLIAAARARQHSPVPPPSRQRPVQHADVPAPPAVTVPAAAEGSPSLADANAPLPLAGRPTGQDHSLLGPPVERLQLEQAEAPPAGREVATGAAETPPAATDRQPLRATSAQLMPTPQAGVALATPAADRQRPLASAGGSTPADLLAELPTSGWAGPATPPSLATEVPSGFTAVARAAASGVAESIVTRAELLTDGSETRFEMRLDPPELGSIWVRLTASPRGVQAHIVAASADAHQALDAALPGLREALQQADVQLTGFELAHGENSAREFASPEQQTRDSRDLTGRAPRVAAQPGSTTDRFTGSPHSGVNLLV